MHMGMTLKQAASILGVSTSASKEEISNAYRELIKQCHPDMNRHAPAAEKTKLDKMFKNLVQARKIMLNPALAEPEPQTSSSTTTNTTSTTGGTYARTIPQPTTTPVTPSAFANMTGGGSDSRGPTARTPYADDVYLGGGARVAQASRIVEPYSGATTSTATPPPVYNTATTFHTDIPRVKDEIEDDLTEEYKKSAEKRYRTFADNIRFTTSLLSTALFIVVLGYLFVTGVASSYELLDVRNPIITGGIATLVKLLIYDPLIAYHVQNKGINSIGRFAVTGIEMIILGVAAIILFICSSIDATVLLPIYAMCGVGALCTLFGGLWTMLKRQRTARKAENIEF